MGTIPSDTELAEIVFSYPFEVGRSTPKDFKRSPTIEILDPRQPSQLGICNALYLSI